MGFKARKKKSKSVSVFDPFRDRYYRYYAYGLPTCLAARKIHFKVLEGFGYIESVVTHTVRDEVLDEFAAITSW